MYILNPNNNIHESKVILSICGDQTLMNNNLYLQYFLAVIYKSTKSVFKSRVSTT